MKRRMSRPRRALVVGIVALALAALPVVAYAESFDRWPPYPSGYGSYGCYHMVRFGETLSGIAARYGASVYGLMQANGIYNPDLIYAGRLLRVPCSYANPVNTAAQCYAAIYWVRPGDTLSRIGGKYGVSPYTLAYTNGLRDPNLVYAGMRLRIPCSNRYAPQPYPMPYPVPYSTPSYGAPIPTPPPVATPTPGTGAPLTVVMRNLAFDSTLLTIHAGQTVIWRNDDTAPHTTTSGSCQGGGCTPSPGWDSGTLNPGQSFSHTFTATGTFPYYCVIHGAMMQGTIMVVP